MRVSLGVFFSIMAQLLYENMFYDFIFRQKMSYSSEYINDRDEIIVMHQECFHGFVILFIVSCVSCYFFLFNLFFLLLLFLISNGEYDGNCFFLSHFHVEILNMYLEACKVHWHNLP